MQRSSDTNCRSQLTASVRRAFTLIELLVVILIIGTMASLMLGGLNVARQRTRIARTEVTIRKIHEIIMPHYERMLTRASIDDFQQLNTNPNTNYARACYSLAARRALQAVELPDGWSDIIAIGKNGNAPLLQMTNSGLFATADPFCASSTIARRLYDVAHASGKTEGELTATPSGSGECLWAIVMRAGFADPGIVGSFRDDEFADPDENGLPHFVDGWGNPILFLRSAPAFVSRYQPAASNAAAESHDAFDLQGVDPMARITLFPLIFSAGPDQEFGIEHRNADGNGGWPPAFSYAQVGYDPYFSPSIPGTSRTNGHFAFNTSPQVVIGPYAPNARSHYAFPFGTTSAESLDNVHNHSMSR